MSLEKDVYQRYLKSLFDFMVNEGYTKKPYPKIILKNKEQSEPIFIRTGYYDPNNKKVVLFVYGRHIKDILRSAAHEFVHHKQNLEGRLREGSYEGDQIINDNKLKKLEEEAYLEGNIGFRSWTETIKD